MMGKDQHEGYKLRIPPAIVNLVCRAHPQLKRKIRAALEILTRKPETGKSLKEELSGLYSYRISRFKIIYRIASDDTIEIITIGPRKIIYEETYKILKKENQ